MDERAKLEHQIELATKAVAYIRDESTASRLRRFADELRQRLFPVHSGSADQHASA